MQHFLLLTSAFEVKFIQKRGTEELNYLAIKYQYCVFLFKFISSLPLMTHSVKSDIISD